MQDTKMKTDMILLAVPAEMLSDAGISADNPVQMYVDGQKLVIERLDDTGDIVCEGDCEDCPVGNTDCDGACDTCPCKNNCEYCEVNEA